MADLSTKGLTAAEIDKLLEQVKSDKSDWYASLSNRLNQMVTNQAPPFVPLGQQRTPDSPRVYSSDDLAQMVRMRLRTQSGRFFDHWHFHKIKDERVIVMIVNDGQVTMLEDNWPLFPSDELVTKLRLLEK